MGTGQEGEGLRSWQRPYRSHSPTPKLTDGETEGSDVDLVTQNFPLGGIPETMGGGPCLAVKIIVGATWT